MKYDIVREYSDGYIVKFTGPMPIEPEELQKELQEIYKAWDIEVLTGNKALREAEKALVSHCQEREECEGCIFDMIGGFCDMSKHAPEDWTVKNEEK